MAVKNRTIGPGSKKPEPEKAEVKETKESKEKVVEVKKEKAYSEYGIVARGLRLSGALLFSFFFQAIVWVLDEGLWIIDGKEWKIDWDTILVADIIFVGIILSFAGTLLFVHKKPTSPGLVYFINSLFVAIPLVIILAGVIGETTTQEKVSIKQGPEIIFERVYTNADPKAGEWTRTFTWGDKFKKGDIVELFTETPLNCNPVYISRGKGFNPRWFTVDNNYYKITVETIEKGKYFSIWLDPKCNVKARVKVTRRI